METQHQTLTDVSNSSSANKSRPISPPPPGPSLAQGISGVAFNTDNPGLQRVPRAPNQNGPLQA